MTTHQRAVHLVGTIPAPDAEAAIRMAADTLGDRLPHTVPDGETGNRQDWIKRIVEDLKNHPDLTMAESGDWSDYERTPRFEVAKGRSFKSLDLDYTDHFEKSWPVWSASEFSSGEDRVLQIGIPSHLDLALVAFGFKMTNALRNVAPFRDATVREIVKIHDRSDGGVVFQLEIPIPLILLSKMPERVQPAVANRLAAELLKVIERSPRGARFGIHLCYGDMNNQSMADPTDCGPLVRLSNALVKAWPKDQELVFIHAPFARGSEAPTMDPAFYEPLAGLKLPAAARFAAGVVHEDLELAQLVELRDRIDGLIGTTSDVGAACGLGRREPERARRHLELSRQVADA